MPPVFSFPVWLFDTYLNLTLSTIPSLKMALEWGETKSGLCGGGWGTAEKATFGVLRKKKISDDAICIISRNFGGFCTGKGGLSTFVCIVVVEFGIFQYFLRFAEQQ